MFVAGEEIIFFSPKEKQFGQQQSECYFAFSYACDESFSRVAKEKKEPRSEEEKNLKLRVGAV